MTGIFAFSLMLLTAAEPRAYVLNTSHSTWDVSAEDLNGDGKRDVVALCCDEESYPLEKCVAVYLSTPDGGYAGEPSYTFKLDPQSGSLFWAETDGKAPRELVVTDTKGASVYSLGNGAASQAGRRDFISLLPGGSKEPRFLKETAKDLDGDGVDEWLIPVSTGYEIRRPAGGSVTIACDVTSEIRDGEGMHIVHKLPSYKLFDLGDGGKKGLAFLSDEFADFAYGDDWSRRKRFEIPVNLEDKWEAKAQMADVDGNGLPDLIVTQTRGTVNLKVLTHFYLASAPFTYPQEPTATFQVDGAIASPLLIDVDGDEKLDVLFVKVPFGVKSFVNFFLLKKLGINIDVHLFNGSGYSEKPDLHTSISLDAPDGREKTAYTMGDFTGDGRLDVALGSGAEKLAIHTGGDGEFISTKPWMTLDIPTFGVANAYDLNGNESEDLIIFHPGGDKKKRIEVVVF